MFKSMQSFFSQLTKPAAFTLDPYFKDCVLMIAKDGIHPTLYTQTIKTHQELLRTHGDEYRNTNEYKFLSEQLHPVPDLNLRAIYRKKIVDAEQNH